MNKHEIYNDLLTMTRERYDACRAEAVSVAEKIIYYFRKE